MEETAPTNIIAFPVIIATWPRNSRETVMVRLDHYQGNNTIDIRTWYPDAEGEMRPGKGITLSVKHVPELAAGLADALATGRSLGLVPDGGADG